MRKIANLPKPVDGIVRVMIYDDGVGVYIFGYTKLEDCGSEWDYWYETESEVLALCESDFGIAPVDWTEIPDPQPNCQDDWINPVRVKGRDKGEPEFGTLEKLVNDKWVEFDPND